MYNPIADEHDAPDCPCAACAVARSAARAEARRRDAVVYGGIARWGHELLGRGWVEGGNMGEVATSALPGLATRALGDVFDQLARIGDEGRNRAHYPTTFAGERGPLTRGEALGLIRAAESALDYARVHLDWLPRPDNDVDASRFRVGDRVRFVDDDDVYAVVGKSATKVMLERNGSVMAAEERDLRTVDDELAEWCERTAGPTE